MLAIISENSTAVPHRQLMGKASGYPSAIMSTCTSVSCWRILFQAHFLSNVRRNNLHGTLSENSLHFIFSSRQSIKKLQLIELRELILSNTFYWITFYAISLHWSIKRKQLYGIKYLFIRRMAWGCYVLYYMVSPFVKLLEGLRLGKYFTF